MPIRKYIDRENRFVELFNPGTGFYIRSGVLDENGRDTDVDPFMRNYPSLIDVGIMGSCIHGRNGLCRKAGVECYQNGLGKREPDMSLEDFTRIVEESKDRVFQIALGGRGDPNKHKNFREICQVCRDNGIVPNYTTSGLNLTDEEIATTKELCGAVAVSWYRQEHTLDAIRRFLDAGIKTNIHYVLGNNSIDEAIERLEKNDFPKGINAVIFLLHKPVGLGSEENVIKSDDPRLEKFFRQVDGAKHPFKIGFDSCTVPGLINNTSGIDPNSFDTCEGGRHSMYITSTCVALPCSFDNQDLRWAFSLTEGTIQEAWNSPQFDNFRDSMRHSCPGCKDRPACMGGCPIKRQIVLCNREEREQSS
jgi:radical SAM protein with 4Fe4S-binding SPASM domain